MSNIKERIVKILNSNGKTISTMESCTGGACVNAITNVPGASQVLNFSAITYSNDFKIKMGVSEEVINKYNRRDFEILSFIGRTKPITIKCNCGHTFTLDRANRLLDKTRKILSLLYLKGSLFPKTDYQANDEIETFVTEEDWYFVHDSIQKELL